MSNVFNLVTLLLLAPQLGQILSQISTRVSSMSNVSNLIQQAVPCVHTQQIQTGLINPNIQNIAPETPIKRDTEEDKPALHKPSISFGWLKPPMSLFNLVNMDKGKTINEKDIQDTDMGNDGKEDAKKVKIE